MDIELKIKEKLEERTKIFNNVFNTPEGQVVYKDLRNALVINPESITSLHTNNITESALIQVGMRLAFGYIDNFLDYKISNK